jgi:hypothetical protein
MSGKTETSHGARRAVTFVRTSGGVSDPRLNGSGAAHRGWQRGSHAPSSPLTIIRAASAAADNAAAFSMTAGAHPLVGQRVAVSVSSAKGDHQHRQYAGQFSGLKGDNSDPRRCPPFCPLAHRELPQYPRQHPTFRVGR